MRNTMIFYRRSTIFVCLLVPFVAVVNLLAASGLTNKTAVTSLTFEDMLSLAVGIDANLLTTSTPTKTPVEQRKKLLTRRRKQMKQSDENVSDQHDDDQHDDESKQQEKRRRRQEHRQRQRQQTRSKVPSLTVKCHENGTLPDGTLPYRYDFAPTFVVVGAQKAGTTALSYMLQEHPSVLGSINREPHFFDWRVPLPPLSAEETCRVRHNYQFYFNMTRVKEAAEQKEPLVVFEKTPSYLTSTTAPLVLKHAFPRTKVVVILRDPVDRLFSHYKMSHDPKTLGNTFEKFINQKLDDFHSFFLDYGTSPDPNSSNSTESSASPNTLLPSLEEFRRDHRAKNVTTLTPSLYRELLADADPLAYQNATNSRTGKYFQKNPINRGFYSIQLRNWMQHYELGKNLMVIHSGKFDKHPQEVLDALLYDFAGLPKSSHGDFDIEAQMDTSKNFGPGSGRKKTGDMDLSIDPSIRQYLEHIYKPFNDELVELLGEEWRGAFDN